MYLHILFFNRVHRSYTYHMHLYVRIPCLDWVHCSCVMYIFMYLPISILDPRYDYMHFVLVNRQKVCFALLCQRREDYTISHLLLYHASYSTTPPTLSHFLLYHACYRITPATVSRHNAMFLGSRTYKYKTVRSVRQILFTYVGLLF